MGAHPRTGSCSPIFWLAGKEDVLSLILEFYCEEEDENASDPEWTPTTSASLSSSEYDDSDYSICSGDLCVSDSVQIAGGNFGNAGGEYCMCGWRDFVDVRVADPRTPILDTFLMGTQIRLGCCSPILQLAGQDGILERIFELYSPNCDCENCRARTRICVRCMDIWMWGRDPDGSYRCARCKKESWAEVLFCGDPECYKLPLQTYGGKEVCWDCNGALWNHYGEWYDDNYDDLASDDERFWWDSDDQ